MAKIEDIQKEIFDTVYQWGRVGVVTDHLCNTFQSLLTGHAIAVKEREIILAPEDAQKLSKILENNKDAKDIKEKIDEELLKL